MNQFSPEYISALAIVIVSTAAMFGYTIGSEQISALIVVLLGAFNMIKKYQSGQVSLFGLKK